MQPDPTSPVAAAPSAPLAEPSPPGVPGGLLAAGGPTRSRWKIWLAVVAVLVLAGTGVGVFVARWSSGPGSPEALAGLVVDVPGRQSQVSVRSDAAASSATGVRWAVTLLWSGPPASSGSITLTQYGRSGQASAALTTARRNQQKRAADRPVPGVANAFISAGAVSRGGTTPITGYGAKGTVYVLVFTQADSEAFVEHILANQLNRLP